MDINCLLKSMTLREKLAQLTQLESSLFTADENGVLTGPLSVMELTPEDVGCAGSVLGATGAEPIRRIQEQHLKNDPHGIPLVFMMDVIHGYRTIFPIPLAIACSWNTEYARICAELSAAEATAAGLHVTFAPMMDLVRDPRWGRVMESAGEDPYLNSLFAQSYVYGYQGENPDELSHDNRHMAACIKHIAAYGAAESGRDYNTAEVSDYTLREFYLPAYKAAVEAGVMLAMTSFNTINGIPSTMNKKLLRDILRNEWGFQGTIISDWTSLQELIAHGAASDKRDAAQKALQGGLEIEMMSNCILQNGEELVRKGVVSEELLDDAVRHVLELKEKLGLFEDPYRGASPERERAVIGCKEHREAARKIAAGSMVVLKNEGDLLPLKREQRIAVIGPYGTARHILGNWICRGDENEAVTLYEGLSVKTEKENIRVVKSVDCRSSFSDPMIPLTDEAVREVKEAAEWADAVILAVGEHSDMSGEARSRAFLDLPEEQQKLAEIVFSCQKPVVTVLFNGRPLDLRYISEKSAAVVEAWFPGSEGGNAVADILYGDILPQGRLTMSFPYCVGQVPVYYNHGATGRPYDPKNPEERYVSRYTDIPNEPLYPFGYGLNYTDIAYKEIILSENVLKDSVKVFVTLENIGNRAANETVQLYIKQPAAERVRPVLSLKAYQQIFIQPGEVQTVQFLLERENLAYRHMDGSFTADSGKYEVHIGANSADTQSVSFIIE